MLKSAIQIHPKSLFLGFLLRPLLSFHRTRALAYALESTAMKFGAVIKDALCKCRRDRSLRNWAVSLASNEGRKAREEGRRGWGFVGGGWERGRGYASLGVVEEGREEFSNAPSHE